MKHHVCSYFFLLHQLTFSVSHLQLVVYYGKGLVHFTGYDQSQGQQVSCVCLPSLQGRGTRDAPYPLMPRSRAPHCQQLERFHEGHSYLPRSPPDTASWVHAFCPRTHVLLFVRGFCLLRPTSPEVLSIAIVGVMV